MSEISKNLTDLKKLNDQESIIEQDSESLSNNDKYDESIIPE